MSFSSLVTGGGHRHEVYLYDTELLQSEYDDPLKAVLFHHPDHLSPDHVLVTAGHLAGIAQFFSMALGEEDARFFQLERGRFEMERCGRFILFVGDMTVTSLCENDESAGSDAKRLMDDVLEVVEFYFGGLEQWHANYEAASVERGSSKARKGESFCKCVAAFLGAFLALQQASKSVCSGVSGVPSAAKKVAAVSNVGLLSRCKRVAKECHEHLETRGCLIRIDGKVALSTFSPTATSLLRIVSSSSSSILPLMTKATEFRLPVGVTLISLADRPNWCQTQDRVKRVVTEKPEAAGSLTLNNRFKDEKTQNVNGIGGRRVWNISSSSSSSSSSVDGHRGGDGCGDASRSDDDEETLQEARTHARWRRTVSARNTKSSTRERLQRREEEDLVSLLRRSLFRLSTMRRSPTDPRGAKEEREEETMQLQQSALYVQRFGPVEMFVGMSSCFGFGEALLRDYWNIGLTMMPKLSLYHRRMDAKKPA